MHLSNSQEVTLFIIFCSSLILLLISFLSIIMYRYQKKQHAHLRSVEELKIAHKNNLLQFQLEVQEQTMQYISREIHDNIGQQLTLAKLKLNRAVLSDGKISEDEVYRVVAMIGESIDDLRDISHSMSSEGLLQNGLKKALEYETLQLSKMGIFTVELDVSEETFSLGDRAELLLFRIVQEAINNIIKHAGATKVSIRLHTAGNHLVLQVCDNGRGSDPNRQTENGLGLQNIHKRAKMLKGNCSFTSEINQGTQLIIQIPIDEFKAAM